MPGGEATDVDAGIGQVGFVGQAHLASAAAEQRLEGLTEILVDALEGFGEFLARNHVDVRDRLLRIADGIQQILPLHAQELLALRGFLELLHGLGIDRTQPDLKHSRAVDLR